MHYYQCAVDDGFVCFVCGLVVFADGWRMIVGVGGSHVCVWVVCVFGVQG